MNTPTRVLLDLRGLVLHCYYRSTPVRTVQNAEGKEIPSAAHAVNEFIDVYLKPILEDHQPINIIAVLEGFKSNARRRAVYPGYKDKPEDGAADVIETEQKAEAIACVESLLLGLGAMTVKTPYCEADDTIAYLVERLEGSKIIYTVDHDLMQLHSPTCKLMIPDRGLGVPLEKTVFKGYDLNEVPAGIVVLYKSIVGDSSDQYGGVKGLGESAFTEIIAECGHESVAELNLIATENKQSLLEEAAKSWEGTRLGKIFTKLVEQYSQWSLCHYLARLHPEWPEMSFAGKVVRPAWKKRVPEQHRVNLLLEKLGLHHYKDAFGQFTMRKWLMDGDDLANKKLAGDLKEVYKGMSESSLVAFDWESYDPVRHPAYQAAKRSGGYVSVLDQVLAGASFCYGPNLQYCFYLPFEHKATKNVEVEALVPFLEAMSETRMVAHNAKFEETVLYKSTGIKFSLDNLPEDSRVLASHVDENAPSLGLKQLSKHWLNYDQVTYSQVVGEGDMRDVSGAEVMDYGCDDSIVCAHMTVVFTAILECERTRTFVKENEVFFDMALMEPYCNGVRVDYDRLAELEAEDEALLKSSEEELRSLLATHCATTNEEGFNVIWPEFEKYARAEAKHRESSEDKLEAKLLALKEKVRSWCAYEGFHPPVVSLTKASISAAARSLGFPALRSLKRTKVEEWAQSMDHQLESQGGDYTPEQEVFLSVLRQAADTLEEEAKVGIPESDEVKSLMSFVGSTLYKDRTTWEGQELNVGSSQQMAMTFYGMMGLPIQVRNLVPEDSGVRSSFDMEGAPSTNETAIKTWMTTLSEDSWQYRCLDDVLTLRGVKTRQQLYYTPYPLWRSPQDGMIHPDIKNCGTITRRPSSSSPNIFQVSKLKDDGKIRSAILPLEDDHLVVSIDFVQQELAILAGLSGDENLLACYVGDNRKDVHSNTAAAIFNVLSRKGRPQVSYADYMDILKDPKHPENGLATLCRKRYAKTTNFLIVYGGSAGGLSRKLIIPLDTAQMFLDAFNKTYPGVKAYAERTVEYARTHGYVLTAFGNRKHCDGILDQNGSIRSSWERQAVNAPIQGTAADVLKKMLRSYCLRGVAEATGASIYAPVYDEIVASVPADKVYQYASEMRSIMSINIPGTPVVLDTSVSVGHTWGNQKELEVFSEASVNEAINNIRDRRAQTCATS